MYDERTEFFQRAAHEIRNPLTSLTGGVGLLIKRWQQLPPERVDELLAEMRRQAGRMGRLVTGLLDLADIEAGIALATEPVDLDEVVREVLPSAETGGGGIVRANRTRLRQALEELIDNARKHGAEPVTVRMSPGTVMVTDAGPGLDREAGELFQPFTRSGPRRSDGPGVGLALARGWVRAMGGDLVYEPDGNRFLLSVTIAPED